MLDSEKDIEPGTDETDADVRPMTFTFRWLNCHLFGSEADNDTLANSNNRSPSPPGVLDSIMQGVQARQKTATMGGGSALQGQRRLPSSREASSGFADDEDAERIAEDTARHNTSSTVGGRDNSASPSADSGAGGPPTKRRKAKRGRKGDSRDSEVEGGQGRQKRQRVAPS